MEILKLSFTDLSDYHTTIPMIKKDSRKVVFDTDSSYHTKETLSFEIDMTKEESISLWKEIMNEDTTSIIAIKNNNKLIAGCITVTNSPKINMLKGDMTNAVLWDIRVNPNYQNLGLATKLLKESIKFAKKMKCKRLLIETQDNNPKAINFYLKNGAKLIETNPDIYPVELNEIQYIFKIEL